MKFELFNRKIRVGITKVNPRALSLGVSFERLKHDDGYLLRLYLFRFVLYLDVIGSIS